MPTRKKTSSKSPKRPGSATPAAKGGSSSGWTKNIVWILIAIVVVVFAVESMNLFHGETLKDFKVQSFLNIYGSQTKSGSFNAWGVGPVGKDKIMVVDQGHDRILVFDREGNLLKSWGKLGNGPKEFNEPSGLTCDNDGNAYVIDTWNSAIKGYDENGNVVLDKALTNGSFYGPRGIGFDGKNFVVADTGGHRVALVTMDGVQAASWGTSGKAPGQFHGLLSVVSDQKGNYFVGDTENNRVQVLDQDGKVIKVFKFKAQVPAVAVDKEGRFYVSTGTGDGGSCVKAYSLKDGYLGDLKDEKGNLVGGDRGLGVTPDDILMVAGGEKVALYKLPPATP